MTNENRCCPDCVKIEYFEPSGCDRIIGCKNPNCPNCHKDPQEAEINEFLEQKMARDMVTDPQPENWATIQDKSNIQPNSEEAFEDFIEEIILMPVSMELPEKMSECKKRGKELINSLLSLQQKRLVEEIEGLKRSGVNVTGRKMSSYYDMADGYNQALEHLLEKLNQLK